MSGKRASLFVTGTDTGVGKTHTVVQLLRLLRAAGRTCAGFKPICCGDRQDVERLLAAGSDGPTADEINPLWLKSPLAPIAAAQVEQIQIDAKQFVTALGALQSRVDHVLVEGVGGWMVPIGPDYFVSNLAVNMNLPVLVVAENRLGCLNHSVLTVQSVAAHGLRCAGLVLNTLSEANNAAMSTNAEVLNQIIDVPVLPGLTENMTELASEWWRALDSV